MAIPEALKLHPNTSILKQGISTQERGNRRMHWAANGVENLFSTTVLRSEFPVNT